MNHNEDMPAVSRRLMLVRGALGFGAAAFLAACNSGQKVTALPDVNWPDKDLYRPPPPPSPRPVPQPTPKPSIDVPTGVIPRSEWARAQPVPALMDPAQPYYRITLHHDGMDTFTSSDRAAAADRLERIRNAHRGRNFGDIGYHYIIDPAGRVWQGRPLNWQGAHVKATNQGNLGICVMGNYMQQRPNEMQLAAIDRFVISQMKQYRVPASRVFTHREIGQSVCPGDNLQPYINESRSSGAMARG